MMIVPLSVAREQHVFRHGTLLIAITGRAHTRDRVVHRLQMAVWP
jgi:hypothetical protein